GARPRRPAPLARRRAHVVDAQGEAERRVPSQPARERDRLRLYLDRDHGPQRRDALERLAEEGDAARGERAPVALVDEAVELGVGEALVVLAAEEAVRRRVHQRVERVARLARLARPAEEE